MLGWLFIAAVLILFAAQLGAWLWIMGTALWELVLKLGDRERGL